MLVLIADDDAVSRKVLERAVSRLGYRTVTASNGEEAWDAFERDSPEVILSDWMMPKLDGIDLCRRVRANPGPGYPYFVMITSLTAKEDALTGMQAGADDYLRKPVDVDELNLRLIAARRITALHRKLEEQRQELERLNKELFEDGRLDALTGIGNRRMMEEELLQVHSRFLRYDHHYAVALFDIDFFKLYNDTCGHPAGDLTLQEVAKALTRESREADMVFRYGGEEFLAVLTGQDIEGGRRGAERLRCAVESLGLLHPGRNPAGIVTVSGGVAAAIPGEKITMEDLIERADQALYRAKEGGRNRIAT